LKKLRRNSEKCGNGFPLSISLGLEYSKILIFFKRPLTKSGKFLPFSLTFAQAGAPVLTKKPALSEGQNGLLITY